MSNDLTERKERWARKQAGKERTPLCARTTACRPGSTLPPVFPCWTWACSPWCRSTGGRLEVKGLVEHPLTLSWEQFHALPQFEDVSDFHCVTTWSKYDCRWAGVAFFTLADLVKPKPEARFVYFTGYDGYSTNAPLEQCLDDDVLVATSFDGKPVPKEHGGPARVIIPKLYAWKGAKFVRTIEFRAEDKPGFWEVRGYSNTADPWTDDRFA